MIIKHLDPFYGRILNANRNGKIAMRCHGFTSVSVLQEVHLSKKFDFICWNRPNTIGLFKKYSLFVTSSRTWSQVRYPLTNLR